MTNNLIWIGTKESDICHTQGIFTNSITSSGSGKNGNHAFSYEQKIRINYNKKNSNYVHFLSKNLYDISHKNRSAKFMYYNPYYANNLPPDLLEHVCCLNSIVLMDLLRSKCEMRALASRYIPIVPYERLSGREIVNKIHHMKNQDAQKYILQENISSGGEGTFMVGTSDSIHEIYEESNYLLSPYFEENVSININFLVFDKQILIFPPSIQIVKELGNRLLFMGSDYHINRILDNSVVEEINRNTAKLANVLKEMGYRGIGGFDYIYTKGKVMFLECNPRFQASTYLINIALEKACMSSVQQLNYSAFEHEDAPDYDFEKLEIPFSCLSYSYQDYIQEVHIRETWYKHKNVAKVLDDGLSDDMIFENNAYLYRIIFNTGITDITPDGKLAIYDNLLPANVTWYQKIISGDILALKISLLNQGVQISQEALEYIKEKGGIKNSVFHSLDIILNNNMVINCPYKINYAEFSPFSIRFSDKILKLYYYNNLLENITLEQDNPYNNNRTEESLVPYRRLSFLGGDRLRIHHTDICFFKRGANSCRFCNLPVNGFVFNMKDIFEVIDFYLEKRGFQHFLIGGGSEMPSKESSTVLEIVKYIRNKTDLPIYLMCLPINDEHVLQELYTAGVTEIGFNIELWEDKRAKEIMPGKGHIPRTEYLKALKLAHQIWQKPYAVRSLLIIGLESSHILEVAVKTLASENIMPILSVFRPLPDSAMSTHLPPANEYLYEQYSKLELICKANNQHLGPDCIQCQNNTLSLPW